MGLSLWEESLMARLIPRYSKSEWETLTELIYPEERRHEFTAEPWGGEGFRHYLNPKIVCLEHYMPWDTSTLLGRRGLQGRARSVR